MAAHGRGNGGHRRENRGPKIHSPKMRHLRPSGSMRELPPTLRDGSCRGCGRKPDELGRCECG